MIQSNWKYKTTHSKGYISLFLNQSHILIAKQVPPELQDTEIGMRAQDDFGNHIHILDIGKKFKHIPFMWALYHIMNLSTQFVLFFSI